MAREQQDQAEKLRKKVHSTDEIEQMMASHLPPRSVYHRSKKASKKSKKQEKQKSSYPVIKLLAVIFILIPIIFAIIYYFVEIRGNEPSFLNNDGYEQIEFEKP
ncbi:hypothetical protein [Bacillus kwashiorkori]|uniref:hypothetical protein n=1 Tax=Bacillus kwashiorkori TaxID=1522318 RepID=UPI0007860EBB|nr:hypothetical protein [Bacillus kwashiorkori]